LKKPQSSEIGAEVGRLAGLGGLLLFVKAFRAPNSSIGPLDAESTGALVASVTDVALVVDPDGIIRDRSFQSEDLASELEGEKPWIGRPLIDTVTIECHAKIRALLKDAAATPADGKTRTRQVNHPSPAGADVPVLYSAMRIGKTRNMLICGRDLRIISTLQRRLLDAQQSMERDYARLRQVETRYRLLFQMAPEAVLIVDAITQRVVEANPAAQQLIESTGPRIADRSFTELFTGETQLAVQALLAGMRASARGEEVHGRLAANRQEVTVSATLFRQENATFFLVRVVPAGATPGAAHLLPPPKSKYIRLVEQAPDGIVLTSQDGLIIDANRAFLDMAELAEEEQARGEPLDRWLGRPGVDLDIVLANLRQRGAVRLFATSLRGEYGAKTDVELSAATVNEGEASCFGFTIRNVGRRLAGERRPVLELPRSVEQLTELIGRVSLKELVRESTDMIERLCIEAALEVTGDNRASAAEMLGLSRQSLYVKLRRYGLGDLDDEPKT
jgi:transcriptional regulator PpsR